MPTLFALGCQQWQCQQSSNAKHGCDKHEGGLHTWWQIGQHRIEPEEEEVRFRCRLNDRRVGLSTGSIRAKNCGTNCDGCKYGCREEEVLPESIRNKGNAIRVRQLRILLCIGGAAHD